MAFSAQNSASKLKGHFWLETPFFHSLADYNYRIIILSPFIFRPSALRPVANQVSRYCTSTWLIWPMWSVGSSRAVGARPCTSSGTTRSPVCPTVNARRDSRRRPFSSTLPPYIRKWPPKRYARYNCTPDNRITRLIRGQTLSLCTL